MTSGLYVDAGPVRAHVEDLLAAGVTAQQLANRSGVCLPCVKSLLVGVHGRGPSERVRRDTAGRLLAVEPERIGGETQGYVDATGTLRRLRSLIALGWGMRRLAKIAGAPHSTFRLILDQHSPVVQIKTRDRILRLYQQLSTCPPPPSAGVTMARNIAARKGWPPPCAWTGDGIDDPAAVPVRRPRRELDLVGKVEDLLLIEPDLTLAEAGARLGRKPDQLAAGLRRRHRGDLSSRLKHNGQRRRYRKAAG